MRRVVIVVIFMSFICDMTFAQQEVNNWLGINSSVSTGYLIDFGAEVDGGASFDGRIGYLFGLEYTREINDIFSLVSGVNYKRSSFDYTYIDWNGAKVKSKNPEFVDLLSIPINIKMEVKQSFFLSGGIQYDQSVKRKLSAEIDDQTGIGINFKMGKDFKISNKTVLTFAPEVVVHGVLPFNPGNHQERLTEIGLRISYKLGF